LITGLQAGVVFFPGKRIGINLEPGVRFKQMYREVRVVDNQGTITIEKRGFTETYFPLSVGVRYRFN
jgi:hypothetical protein